MKFSSDVWVSLLLCALPALVGLTLGTFSAPSIAAPLAGFVGLCTFSELLAHVRGRRVLLSAVIALAAIVSYACGLIYGAWAVWP